MAAIMQTFCILLCVILSVQDNSVVTEGRDIVHEFYTRYTTREVDLVFVLDRSSSISHSGWAAILGFIRSLLEHFTISSSNTRVAIVTFSSTASVDINDLHEGRNNKCHLVSRIQRQLSPKVPSGFTATYEALKKVSQILLTSRLGAKKAVFVLTDGRSNIGPPPVRASVEIRFTRWNDTWKETALGPQVEIYAFGIKDAYMPELRSIASSLPNHTYFIPNFTTFEQLARSLHNDGQSETWELVGSGLCRGQCSVNAFCTCGTRSGEYICVCREGYQGDGFTCSPCPKGTFKASVSPFICQICPSNSTTVTIGATSDVQCICHPPYHQTHRGGPCEIRTCPALPKIANGFKFFVPGRVRDEFPNTDESCLNLPETSCHYQCNHGYRLDSHPGLICLTNGTWSGKVPQCKVVDCLTLEYHHQALDDGDVVYLNGTTVFGSLLTATCRPGSKMFGDSARRCTLHGTWSGTRAWCIEARCPAIRRLSGAIITPTECSHTRMMPGSVCVLSCLPGYRQEGPTRKTCSSAGSWDITDSVSCHDITPPNITCPSDIQTPVTEANYAVIHWKSEEPIIFDNSPSKISLNVIGASGSPKRFSIGYHQLKYVARDQAGNEDFCLRSIHVVAKIIRSVFCPANITLDDVPGNDAVVTWPAPMFVDHNNGTVDFVCSRSNGSRLAIGTHNIRCSSVEGSSHCLFSITLIRRTCAVPAPPLHGSVSCTAGSGFLKLCSVSCNDDFDFHFLPQTIYKCDLQGNWILRKPNTFWPPCSRKYNPRRVKMQGSIRYHYHHGDCAKVKDKIVAKFLELVEREAWNVCGDSSCNIPIDNVQVLCGEESRKKRNAELSSSHGIESNSTGELTMDTGMKVSEPNTSVVLDNNVDSVLDITGDSPVEIKSSAAVHDESETDAESESAQTVDESDMNAGGESVGNASELRPFETDAPVTTELLPLMSSVPSSQLPSAENNPVFTTARTSTTESGTSVRLPSNSSSMTLTFELVKESNLTSVNEIDQVRMVDDVLNYADTLYNWIPQLILNLTDEGNDSSIVFSPVEEDVSFSNPTFTACDPGQVIKMVSYYVHSCVSCPVGSYYDDGSCVQCPVGQYQDEEEQFQCKLCPSSSTTFQSGAMNITDCRELCQPGYFSETGLEPCIPCAIGYYGDQNRSTSCKSCPEDTSTATKGVSSVDNCRRRCNPGYYGADSGLEICHQCPLNSYQPAEGATGCMLCPDDTVTLSQGSVSENSCVDSATDPCTNVTACGHHGACVDVNSDGVVCNCSVGFSGAFCEVDEDDCLSIPCSNNSVCEDLPNDFLCVCEPGFTGKTCDLDIDECLSSPCVNNGSCEDLVNGYRCYCLTGFTGAHCENTQECTPVQCRHGSGVFQDGVCSCSCITGYAGERCDVLVDLCSSHPCDNAVDCTPVPNDLTCTCLPGFSGKWCEFEIDECSSSPCQNGARCYDRLSGFLCKCPSGFTGHLCQTEVSRDFDLVFENPSSSAFVTFPWETIPVMTEVSVCFWVRTNQMMGFGTVFSYSVQQSEFETQRVNELSLADMNGLKFYVGGQLLDTGVHLDHRVWHHVCAMWSSNGGVWGIVVNHTTAASGAGVNRGSFITGGGSFVIGQSQGIMGEAFNFWESFVGEITEFNMFDDMDVVRVNQTLRAESCLSVQSGSVIPWTSLVGGVRGGVIIRNKSHCLDVNECLYPSIFPCGIRHQCQDLIGSYNCSSCMYGYHGASCSLPVNECALNICRNGAWCVDGSQPHDTECTCQTGFTGPYCESVIDFCQTEPCLNNGSCTSVPGSGYHCVCPRQNMGRNCETLGDACWQNPCQNGGSCVADGNRFRCVCHEGYVGNFCENSTKFCQTNPCRHGGICVFVGGRQKCICPSRWKGRRCEVSLVPDCSVSPCLNGGSCFLSPNSIVGYECQCPLVRGVRWDANCGFADPCERDPCRNGGLCIHLLNNTYSCSCRGGFWGRKCELDYSRVLSQPTSSTTGVPTVSICGEVHCLNGGTCVTVDDSFSCRCGEEYGGNLCELKTQTVVKTYAVSLVLTEPFSTINKNVALFEQQFKYRIMELFHQRNVPGSFNVEVTSIKAGQDSDRTVIDFHLIHTQRVTQLSDLTDGGHLSVVLWHSLLAGSLTGLPASRHNFKFEELKSDGTSSQPSSITVYLSLGLAALVILLILLIIFFVIRSRRSRQYKGLFHRVNNSPDLVLNIVHHPDDPHSHRGSCTEENPYADVGDMVLPYEVTHWSDLKEESFGRNSSKRGLKQCNLEKAAAQKAMGVTSSPSSPGPGTTGHHQEIATAPADDYLHPVTSKNDLDQLEVTKKDDKQLLKIGGKGHINLAFDKDLYLLPKPMADSNSEDCPKKHVYVNDSVQESKSARSSESGYVPFQPAEPSYVNETKSYNQSLSRPDKLTSAEAVSAASQNNGGITSQESSTTPDVPTSDAVCGTTKKLLDLSEPQDNKAPTSSKTEPAGSEDSVLDYLEVDYLEVLAPQPGDPTPVDPAKRELPPLPPNAALFAQGKQ